ncbi:MAG: glycosyltransferase family 2 protein [Actinomycetaceae bacterium]|nr:glycosyltransferase family 2 protein [Actinomycetaceae bacterium]
MSDWTPKVSIGVIALNEEEYLPRLLDNICAQDYPHDLMEVFLIDSGSTDRTRDLMHDFARSNTSFRNVRVEDNPKRITAAGWNIFLRDFSGEVAIRIDAHAKLPPNFVSQSIAVLAEGEQICGGTRPCTVPEDATDWNRVLLAAEESMFGSSIADYRGGQSKPTYTKSLFHAAMRRAVVEAVGPASEVLLRAEDNDFYYRVRQAGYQLRLDPRIVSYQIVRSSLRSMIKQKYGNGYWMGRACFIQPGAVSAHHLVPFAFVTSLTASAVLAATGRPALFKLICGSYVAADILMSIAAAKESPKSWRALALPAIFPTLHIAYGIGTTRGLVDGLRS